MIDKTMWQTIKDDRGYIIVFSVFASLFLFFVSKMSPLYPINEWSDVNVYFNIGKAMMNGRALYTEAFDHKGPLIFIIYGLGYLISNTTFLGVFVIQVLFWVVLLYSVFKSAQIFLRQEYAFLVAILVPLLLLNYIFTGGSPEEFILIFSSLSLCLFYQFYREKDCAIHPPKVMFVHGVVVAAVFFIKLNLLVFWCFPLVGILICLFLAKSYDNLKRNILAFLAGIFIVSLPIILYLLANDALKEGYEVYIVFNKKYGGLHDWQYTLTLMKERFYDYVLYNKIGAISSLIGAFVFPVLCVKNKVGKVVFLFTGFALFFMIFAPRTFHFYYPLSVYVFVIPGLICVVSMLGRFVNVHLPKLLLGCLVALVLFFGVRNRNFYDYDMDILLRRKNPISPEFAFAEIINKENEKPVLVNLGFGLGNSIFTLCNIVPQHKYFLTPNIYYGMYPDIRDSQTRYVLNKEADFLIIDNFAFNYEYFRDLDVLHQNYELVETFVNSPTQIKGVPSIYYLYKKRL